MSDFKSRLIEEKEELDKKMHKLRQFLSSGPIGVEDTQLALLQVQSVAMETYSEILHQRIERL